MLFDSVNSVSYRFANFRYTTPTPNMVGQQKTASWAAGRDAMSGSAESRVTPEALRARAEMLVTVSENTRLPLSGNGSPELIAGVQAEGVEPEVALDQVLFELRGPDGHVWTLTLDGRCTGFPEGTIMMNLALPLTLALIGKMKIQGAALAAQASNSVEAPRPDFRL